MVGHAISPNSSQRPSANFVTARLEWYGHRVSGGLINHDEDSNLLVFLLLVLNIL